jgi:hypothetical protein
MNPTFGVLYSLAVWLLGPELASTLLPLAAGVFTIIDFLSHVLAAATGGFR